MLETTCTMCHSIESPEELFEFEEHQLCVHCLEEYTLLCACCGEGVLREDSCGDDNISLCESCYDRDYTRCTECERVISHHCAYYEDDYNEDAPYCSNCYHEAAQNFAMHSYDYKHDMIFYGEGKRFFGVELEIDCGCENSEHARQILAKANYAHEHLYYKHDGSLHNGMELVSHPMTLGYHQDEMTWKDVLQKARELSYRSHQSSTCGLHIHVNRDSLGTTYREQNDCIARILYFVESHWLELLRFSRRTESQMNQWAARYGRKDSPKEVFDNAQKCCARYSCVNLTNDDIIELNYNNHPFLGSADGTKFALAHNGVLHNDAELKKEQMLPKTKIEMDSYVAVLLLEKSKTLSPNSLKNMAESVEGSFVFTVLDEAKLIPKSTSRPPYVYGIGGTMNILEWLSSCYERYPEPPTEDELSAQADSQEAVGQHMFQCGVLVETELGLELYYRLRRQEDEATANRLREGFNNRPES